MSPSDAGVIASGARKPEVGIERETQHPKGDKLPDPQGPDEVPPQEPTEEGLPEGGEEDTPSPDPEVLGE
jgi:hypothetical protein